MLWNNRKSMIEGARIFITGGAGFIGSTLAGMFIEKNEIVIYDNFERNSIQDKPFAKHKNLTVIEGDVIDFQKLTKSIDGANYVVHTAAIAGIDTVIVSPTKTLRVNLIGTANALEAARGLKDLKRFIDFSTSEVFGTRAFNSSEDEATAIGAVGESRWSYAVSKLAGEHLTHAYHKEMGMPIVTVRPFNIYGPGQVGEGAILKFILRAIRNENIEIHGTGTQIRAWCFVDDLIDALVLCMIKPEAIGQAFNIGNARAVTTIFGLANTVVRICNSGSKIAFVRRDYADIELRIPSVRKANELLGYEAKIDLEEGIAKTAEYYRKAMKD
jgi:UDP-glucose 4-epimerase